MRYRGHLCVVGAPRRHVPTNEERAAYFRRNGTTVAEQVRAALPVPLTERLFLAGCDAAAACLLGLRAARRAIARARRALKGGP